MDEGRVLMVTGGWVRVIINLEELRLEEQSLHGHAQHVERGGIGLGKLMEHTLGHLRVAVDSPFQIIPSLKKT